MGASVLFADSFAYRQSILEWQKTRDGKLRASDGWLALVDLEWLKPGDNTVRLPKDSAPGYRARVRLEGARVTLLTPGEAERALSYDEHKPDVIHAGSVAYYVIKRGDKFGLRVKDAKSRALVTFQGKYFAVNPELHFAARLVADDKKIPILNVLGQTEMQESPGLVEFTYRGQAYHLRPIFEDKTLFFLFKDPTNKTQTYQAGRMLNTPLPKDGKVDLDFNRAYNPPCTFTPFATCPLPPKENALPFPVEAGELRYGKGHVEYAER